jgi:hypothetical protein
VTRNINTWQGIYHPCLRDLWQTNLADELYVHVHTYIHIHVQDKEYIVTVSRDVSDEHLKELAEGVMITTSIQRGPVRVRVCMHVCIYVCVCVWKLVIPCMHACMHVCMLWFVYALSNAYAPGLRDGVIMTMSIQRGPARVHAYMHHTYIHTYRRVNDSSCIHIHA